MSKRVLIHVEDPGAANWILPLLPALHARGVATDLVADGAATSYVNQRGVTTLFDIPNETADFVLIGTSENLASRGLSLVETARAQCVPCAAVVDQPANAEHRFRGNSVDPLHYLPDWIFVSDAATANHFALLGVASDRCVVVGNPHHDRVIAVGHDLAREGRSTIRKRLFPHVPEQRSIVVFVSEIGYIVNPEGNLWQENNGFSGRGVSSYRTAIALEEALDACSALVPRPFFVLRLHPKNGDDEFAAYRSEIDAVSRHDDPLALVFSADLVFGITSALLEDASILGRPTLVILPRVEERQWLAMLEDGRIPYVLSREQLRSALPELLHNRKLHGGLIEGGAVGRMADFIISAISR